MNWLGPLRKNPLLPLSLAENPALIYFINRDLIGKELGPVDDLWILPEPEKLICTQLEDGSWHYSGKQVNVKLGTNYHLLQTFRNLRYLVENYGFTRAHPTIEKAAKYIFSCQTNEGDIRGILSNQYMPYYMGCLLELLIKSGFVDDNRVRKGLSWLLSHRQNDGGWINPLLIYKMEYFYKVANKDPIPPDRTKPFSHLVTGMVLRAFAAHPHYCVMDEVKNAANLLKTRLFKKDAYSAHQAVKYWYSFQFPFWWTDLLSTLDTLSKLMFPRTDVNVVRGLNWFIENQGENGLWRASYEKRPEMDLWVTLAVCRVFKRFYSPSRLSIPSREV